VLPGCNRKNHYDKKQQKQRLSQNFSFWESNFEIRGFARLLQG
jgi:hypothetical protein